jgi:hypothetical protein
MTVADLKLNERDQMGATIVVIYGFKPPEYAVYRTKDRVMLQFADGTDRACEQRRALARINPLRGEINGLVDGWRTHRRKSIVCKAERYDRRVGDALVVAFEDDVASAETLLKEIKQNILDERVATARFQYLAIAFNAGVFAMLLIGLAMWLPKPSEGMDLLHAAMAGAAGAFFSIALGIRGRTILPDLQKVSNSMDAVLRMVIGLMGGAVLMGLVIAGVVNIKLGDAGLDSGSSKYWLFVLIVGFIAGFSERFVPDLLAKASGSTDAPPTPKPAVTVQRAAEQQPLSPAAAVSIAVTKDEDPLSEEGAAETCTIGVDLHDDQVTSDASLPPASGGVAKAKAA